MTTRRRAGAGRDRTSRLMLEIRLGYRRGDGGSGLRQTDAAALAGLTQSKISRGERGTYTLKPDEARHYAMALGATGDQVAELVRLCGAVEPITIAGQARLTRDGAKIQGRIGELEWQSARIRAWQPTMIHGLLQTWPYTVALIEFEPPEDWATRRRDRTVLLDDRNRRFEVVMSEAALRWVVGSRRVMRDQLRHLVELSERPNVDIGIVPFGQVAIPPPESAFHLYEDRCASVATDVGTTFLEDRNDLDAFASTFERLTGAALHDGAARRLIERVARVR